VNIPAAGRMERVAGAGIFPLFVLKPGFIAYFKRRLKFHL
jgi:hypothetical protein